MKLNHNVESSSSSSPEEVHLRRWTKRRQETNVTTRFYRNLLLFNMDNDCGSLQVLLHCLVLSLAGCFLLLDILESRCSVAHCQAKPGAHHKMEGLGAYGGGKAGGVFDPISFVQRPQVILRAVCWLFSIIVFGCISSQGWIYNKELEKEECLYDRDSNACNYGVGISVIAFLASMGFLAGEYLFEQMSSVKTRKHYVLGDLGFSGFWAFLYFVGFCYLWNKWNKSVAPANGYGVNNVQAAIAFSFFSIFTWAACAYFAFQRFRQGADAAFATNYEADTTLPTSYPTYPGAPDGDQQYQEPPFSGGINQRGSNDFQAPAY